MTWETLLADNPWPATRPDVPEDLQGWFGKTHEGFLDAALRTLHIQSPLVVELGTWKGRSASFWLNHPLKPRLICVDRWDPASTYAGQALAAEPHVFETCVRNLWKFKDRCILVRGETVDGVVRIHGHAVQPDLVYVDAGHDYENVAKDIAACRKYFPWAKVVGDDYQHEPVQRAVAEVAKANAMKVETAGRYCWGLVEHGTRQIATYEREYGSLPVAGATVFDWGADWGSTARWFLQRGAKKVVASEAKVGDLVRLSLFASIEPRIEVHHAITEPKALEKVLAGCNAAKVDVEGAERLLLNVPDAALRAVKSWAMETHSKDVDARLKKRFTALGFAWKEIRKFSNPQVRVVEARR